MCSLFSTLETLVQKENFHSVDDVSVLIYPMISKPKVITTEEAKASLQECNISSATNEKSQKQLKTILHDKLDSASYHTVWKCVANARFFLSRAFNDSAIKSGFEKAGLFRPPSSTFSPEVILSQCPHWRNLSTEDGQWLIDQLPRFYEIFREHYYLPEESFSILLERAGIDNSSRGTGKGLKDLVCNRQRLVLSLETTI